MSSVPPAPTTLDQVQLPLLIRAANRLDQVLNRFNIQFRELSADKLMARAMRETGLSDWGEDADIFKQEVDRLVRSYREDADLSLVGRVAVTNGLTRWLSNRLKTQQDFKEHPEILEQPVTRPLFVAGLPRSGTTLLHRLLAQDPAGRVPLLWELMFPSPPPTTEGRDTDPRIKEAKNVLNDFLRINPKIQVIHSLDPREPEECIWVLEEFFSYVHANVETYIKWLLAQDLTRHYRFYRKQLQLLQWRFSGTHWILKTPFHTAAMDAILSVFPDACIVQTHRDPVKVIASFCSLIASSHRVYSRKIDPQQIGQMALYLWGIAVERAMKVREQADPKHFYDVYYEDTISDPVGTTRCVYEYFGYRFTPEHEASIKRWLAANPQNKHGVHHYTLEQFGLDKQTVQRHFARYIEQFKLGAKSAGV